MHAEKHSICHPCSALQREVRVRGWFLWQAQCRWHKTDVAARGTELIQHSRLNVWSVSSSPQLGWKIKPCRQLSNFYIFGNKKPPQKRHSQRDLYKWVRFQFFFPPWFFGAKNPSQPERSSRPQVFADGRPSLSRGSTSQGRSEISGAICHRNLLRFTNGKETAVFSRSMKFIRQFGHANPDYKKIVYIYIV